MSWSSGKELTQKLRGWWESGKLLGAEADPSSLFPLSVKLKGPTSRELSTRFAEVNEWIAQLRRLPIKYVWRSTNHRVIGENEYPTHAVFADLDSACRFLGVGGELRTYRELVHLTSVRAESLLGWVRRRPLKLLELSDRWAHLLNLVDWLRANPRPGVYLRQVDLPGIDSKFLAGQKGVLRELLELALEPTQIDWGASSFEERFGFLEKPLRVRWRRLDPAVVGCSDLTVSMSAFAQSDPEVERVFVVENEINFLTFPSLPESLVIFGSGFAVGQLKNVPWLANKAIFYWGDIDTHGFAILSLFRSHYPQTRSFLMDRATFLSHEEAWVTEARPTRAALPHLCDEERALYHSLVHEEYGVGRRLEQEMIRYGAVVEAALNSIAPGPDPVG